MKHFPYPDIGQFRQVIRNVTSRVRYAGKDANGEAIYDGAKPLPSILYRGTVKSHGCVHEDTLITLANGDEIPIKDVKLGTSIVSFNLESRKLEFDTVSAVIVQDLDKEWVMLEFDDGNTLKCTEDHPILTKTGWVKAGELTSEHEIVNFSEESFAV